MRPSVRSHSGSFHVRSATVVTRLGKATWVVSIASLIAAQIDQYHFFQDDDRRLGAGHVAFLAFRCVLAASIICLGLAIFWRNVQYRLLGVLLTRAPVILLLCQLTAYFGLEAHTLAEMAKVDGGIVWLWLFADNFATVYSWLCMIGHDVLLVTPGARRLWFLVALGVHTNGAASRVGRLVDYEQAEIFGVVSCITRTRSQIHFPRAADADAAHLAPTDDSAGRDPHLACYLCGGGFLQCTQCGAVARPRVFRAREVRQRTADALRRKWPHVLAIRARYDCAPYCATREHELAETEHTEYTEHNRCLGARPTRAATWFRPGARRRLSSGRVCAVRQRPGSGVQIERANRVRVRKVFDQVGFAVVLKLRVAKSIRACLLLDYCCIIG